MSRTLSRTLLALLAPLGLGGHPCQSCHPKETASYAQSAMSLSLRRAGAEPEGSLRTASGTVFTIRSGSGGARQRLERTGEVVEYPVAYVIGSGKHASGYLIAVGDHLFQSPLCYYANRGSYDLAPGYELLADPDFTRAVGQECVFCHAGRALHMAGTINRYSPPFFTEEAISCGRCHGPADEHLRRPVPGSIVNPAKLTGAERDSICEQCHLAGAARIPNPGKEVTGFRAGQLLEETFTVYMPARPPGAARPFKVISHAEQLAQSACQRNSQGRLWCGTCHDPHPAVRATAETYNARCETCHGGKLPASHPVSAGCIGCHMPRRQARDGGHTVFTDHRIAKRPEPDSAAAPPSELTAWREPPAALRARNLALAYVDAGIAARSPAQIVRGYRMLTEVQKTAPDDVAVLEGIGRALLLGGQPREAVRAFTAALRLEPGSAANEKNVGVACLEAGRLEEAAAHLERALDLDPLLLEATAPLQEAYRRQGLTARASDVANRIRRAMGGKM